MAISQLRVVTFLTKPFVYYDTKMQLTGICVKILKQLSRDLNFDYNISRINDCHYGSETMDGKWSGLIGELQRDNADIAIQAISVTEERSRVVNFTAPFMMSGIAAAMKATHVDQGGESKISQNYMRILYPTVKAGIRENAALPSFR